ncbi:uncharacterized protein LOC123521403 [Echinops telfairi]|uniref:Uncharacterized protein LOC123521403 n=1 Tax=Echinops telfairi TaxID=9371 RepID=A0AC55CVR1_ECHTE|nr:uncharacterized protein LOC123521403 [Echinops telfairi]
MQSHKTPPAQPEQGLQPTIEEPHLQSHLEILPEQVSSIFQIEQEDISEWGVSEASSFMLKSQEAPEVQQTEESHIRSEDEQPASDSRAPKRISLKVSSSELLQIKGQEVKRMRRSRFGFQPLRPRKCLKASRDPKLVKKSPHDYHPSKLHDLCTVVPARTLPVDLCLASRVCHTTDKKGHDTVPGTFFLDNHYTDEEQRARLLLGIPATDDNEENVTVPSTVPEIQPELTQGTGQQAPKSPLQVLGKEVSAYSGFTKLFWNPSAPKFSVPVSVMKETLYSKYESAQTSRILMEKYSSDSRESVIKLSQHSTKPFSSSLLTTSMSYQDIQQCVSSPRLSHSKIIVSWIASRTEEISAQSSLV